MAQASPPTQPPVRKRRRKWPYVVGGLVALIVIIAVASNAGGGSSNPATTPVASSPPTSASHPAPAAPAAKTATVGDAVAFSSGGDKGTVTLNGVRSMTTAEGPLSRPSGRGRFLVVNVTVANTAGQVSPDPLFFQLTAPDGTTYQPALGVLDNQISSNQLAPGRQARGEVAFDVPAQAVSYLLDYQVFGSPLATFNVPAN